MMLADSRAASAQQRNRTRPGREWWLTGGGMLLLLISVMLHITQGEASLTMSRAYQALFAPGDALEDKIIWTLRLPRAVIGILAGGALAVAAVLLQGLTRNPLASAGTLGINAGAQFMVVLAAIFIPTWASSISILLALLGGAAGGVLSYLLAGGRRSSPVRMALAGMIITLTLSSFTGALQLMFENETQGLFLWGAGSLIQNDWSGVAYAWPWIVMGGLAAFLLSRPLDMLALGEETAVSLGQNIGRIRFFGLAIAVLLAAITVSVVGPIGFVGLIAPHLLRLLGVIRHRMLIPASFIWGAILVILSDNVAMLFNSSLGQLPVGAVTALVGGPWLIWLAMRTAATRAAEVPRATSSVRTGAAMRSVPFLGWLLGLMLLLAALVVSGLAIGAIKLPLADIMNVLNGGGEKLERGLVWNMRLPRTLVAALAGMALAVSGLLIQGVVRNPLADPSIIGVTSGAGVGVVSLIVLWPQATASFYPLAAFSGAFAAAFAVYFFSRRSGLQPAMLALIGIAVSAMGSAIIQMLVIYSKMGAGAALAWIAGSTYSRAWPSMQLILGFIVIFLPIGWMLARKLDVLQFNDHSAVGLGMKPDNMRLQIGLVGVVLAAASVSVVGTVGFIGLIAPHAARLMVGPYHRKLLVISVLLGAVMLVVADLVGRSVLAPREIPSGLVVAVVGAPYFVWLMYRSQRK